MIKRCLLCACAAVLAAMTVSLGGELSVGAVSSVTVNPYKSYDMTVLPLPLVQYASDTFFIRGTSAGVHLFKNDKHEISVGGSYFGTSFRRDNTDDDQLKTLDSRHQTVMAEAAYSYVSAIGLFRAKVGQDVLDHSRGQLANLSWHVPWIADRFIVMPGVGVEYASDSHNEYYYGISDREAARGGAGEYDPGSSFTPYATLEAKFSIRDKWDIVAKGQMQYLSRRVKDSPMVGKSYSASVMAGVQYTF